MKQIVKLFRAAIRRKNQSRKCRGLNQRRLGSETLEKRQVLASDVLVAHNYLIAEDVNRDMKVTAADALSVINQISRNGGSQNLAGLSRGEFTKHYDVSGDNKISPLDALRVINTLARGGEGLGPNDEVVEYILTPRTVTDTEFDSTKFNPSTRDLSVAVGETFFLELGYNDLRNLPDGDTGVFQFVADIVTGTSGTIEPVLTETQILQIDQGYRNAASGNLVFTRAGITETPFTIPVTTFNANALPSLRTAITTLYGLTAQQFTVVSLGPQTITETVNNVPVTRSVIEFRIRFTDFALANMDIADLSVSGDLRGSGNETITVASSNVSTEPRLPSGGINPRAIRDNISFQSRTFGNQAFYELPSGNFNSTTGAVTGGGLGRLTTSGVPDVIEEPFDAFSVPFRAIAATPAGGIRVQAGVTPASTDPNVDNTVLRYGIRLAEGRLAQVLPAQASATTVFLESVAGFQPLPGETTFLIKIGAELMLVTSVNTAQNTFTVVRGQNSTTIARHEIAAPSTPTNPNFNVITFEDEVIPADKILIDLGTNPAISTDGLGFVNVIAVGGTTNTAPTISAIADRSVAPGVSTGAVAFTVGDAETAVGSLTVTATSTNAALVPVSNIVFGGSGASRTVTVTPVAGQTGSATINVIVNDGTTTTSEPFVLTVTAANTAPTISAIADRSVAPGVSTGAIAFTVGDAETAVGSLTVSATSTNAALVPVSNIVFGGSGASRTVTVTPVAGQTGSATINVIVNDGTTTTSEPFVLTVTAANTAPTISAIADRSVAPGVSTGAIAFTVGDAETAVGSLTVSATSTNAALVPVSNIVFGGSGASRTVTVTPVAGQTGSATITVIVNDGTTTTSEPFVLTVTAANTAPTISAIADRSVAPGVSTGAIAFTVGDAETAVGSLTVSATSTNAALVPVSNIVFGGSGANRTVTVTPVAGQTGSATITVIVNDGTTTTSEPFVLTVTAANTAPTISAIADRTVAPGVSTGAIAFTVGDTQTPVANLTVTATSSNSALVPVSNIVFGGSGASRTVTVTPVAGQTGSATITVIVSDGTLTASEPFVLSVVQSNTAPTISDVANVTINEDANTGALTFTVGDSQTAAGSLVVSGTSSNTTLVPNANIVFGGSGANRTVTVTPVANRSGSATITLTVSDGSLSSSDAVVLTVNSVNDAPVGTSVTRSVVSGGTFTFATTDFPLTDPLDSPANTLGSVVILSLPSSTQGTLRLNGTAVTANQTISVGQISQLTFTSANGFTGQSGFTFRVLDNGGVLNGGVNADPTARNFTFNVTQFQPSVISGKIFTDFLESLANPIRNGELDPGESTIGGLQVRLTSPATSNVSGVAVSSTVVTNADGEYTFNNVVPGDYTVTFLAPAELIQGSQIPGSASTTTLSATSYRIVVGQAGGVNAQGNDFTVLGTTGNAADTLDILIVPYTSRNGSANTAPSTAFAAIDSANEQLFFELGDGYEDVEFAEFALNADKDAALLTLLLDNGDVETKLLSGDDFAVSRNGRVIRIFGNPDSFAAATSNQSALESEFGDYRDAIDAILAQRP